MAKPKIDGAEYESRKEGLRQIIDHLGPKKILEQYTENPVRTRHGLYDKLCFDRRNDDNHPWFVSGRRERILPFEDVNYTIYPNDSDDRHLDTMLKRAMHEIMPATRQVDFGQSGPSF